jgi:hypothetical protein
MQPTSQGRRRGLIIAGVLMILFGVAEGITGFTHQFFVSTAFGANAT